jgi:hypothetical protein
MRTKRMRASTPTALSLAAGVLFAAPLANRVGAQGKPPQLKATVDLRIDSALVSPVKQAFILPGATGDVVVAPIESQGAMRWFDASGRASPFKSPISYSRDSDIRWLSRIAWSGSTLVAIDPGFRQIALLDKTGKVTKSLEYPGMIRPNWSDRHKYPLFSRYDAITLYANGDWLVRPAEPKELMSTPEYDSTYSYFMRTNENGSIQRVIGKVPRSEGILERRSGGSRWVYRVPFAARTLWEVSADGSRIAIVSQAVKGPDSASYRVTVLGEKGDTVFSKKFSTSLTAIPKKSVDSVLARVSSGLRDHPVDELRGLVAKEIPAVYAPVEGLLLGADKTVWLQLHSTGVDRQWLALDPAGTPIGVASVAKNFVARAGDRSHLWGFEAEGEQLRALVRYAISTAPAAGKK